MSTLLLLFSDLFWYILVPAAGLLFVVRVIFPIILRFLPPGGAIATFLHDMVAMSSELLGWLRGLLLRARDGLTGRGSVVVMPPRVAPAPPRAQPVRPAAPVAPAGAPVVPLADGQVPPAWGPVIAWIGGFEAEDDAELIAFMKGEAAAQLACADAWRAVFDTHLHVVGLDPSSIQGIAEYSDVRADTAHDVSMMLSRFLAVYREVREYLASGGTLPHDGKFLTGEGGEAA